MNKSLQNSGAAIVDNGFPFGYIVGTFYQRRDFDVGECS